MAELHIIGQIKGASNFYHNDLFCVWKIMKGERWSYIKGTQSGQTHVCSRNPEDDFFVWSHPIDVQYSSSSIVGWPKIVLQVWYQDIYNRNDFAGYGILNVPTTKGKHDVEVVCWRPYVGILNRIKEYVMGGKHQVKDESIIWSVEDRRKLRTISTGKIHFSLNILENFSKHGVVTDSKNKSKGKKKSFIE